MPAEATLPAPPMPVKKRRGRALLLVVLVLLLALVVVVLLLKWVDGRTLPALPRPVRTYEVVEGDGSVTEYLNGMVGDVLVM